MPTPKDHDLQVQYHLHAHDLLWDGDIHLELSSEVTDYVRLFLPPVGVLPSFKIFLNGQPPTRKIGRLAVFKKTSSPLHFTYQFYFPAICSFHRLFELLPEVVYPVPTAFAVTIDPPPTAISLKPQETPGVFSAPTKAGFFQAVVSSQPVTSAAARCHNTTLTAYCSPCFTAPAAEFLAHSLKIYDQCTRWLGDSGFAELNLFFDWIEPYQETNRILSWNSGGNIYLLVPESRQIPLSLLLTLAHEMIHEWNGRKIYPASQREWWFLEGVTQLLAFQMVSVGGSVPVNTLVDFLTQALEENVTASRLQGHLGEADSPFPLPFSYPQSLKFAYRLEKLLRRSGHRNANLLGILRELIRTRGGAAFTEDAILQLLGQYIDVTQVQAALPDSAILNDTALRECLFSPAE